MNPDKLFCSHSKLAKARNESLHTFCEKCGIIVMKNTDSTFMYLLKPVKYERSIEFDPLEHFNTVKRKIMSSLENSGEWYLNHRKQASGYLYKLIVQNHYSDEIFYTALSYLDTILISCDDISETKLDLTVIGCFLLALKFTDNDPIVPDMSNIPASNGKFLYNLRDVKRYEELCLKLLKYKLDTYTPYDMLRLLLYNGIIFEAELYDQSEDLLNSVYTLATQLLKAISTSYIFLRHNQVQIAFSVVYMTRRHFHLDKALRKKLTRLYQIPFKYFSQCVKDVKKFCLENSSRIPGMKKIVPTGFPYPQSPIGITPKFKYHTSVNLNEICGRKEIQQLHDPNLNLQKETQTLSDNTMLCTRNNSNSIKQKCRNVVPNSLCSSISTAHNSLHAENRKGILIFPQSSKELEPDDLRKSLNEVRVALIKEKRIEKESVNNKKNSQLRASSVLPWINEKK